MSQAEAAARVDGLDSADLLALVVAAATRLEQLSSAVSLAPLEAVAVSPAVAPVVIVE